MTVWGTRARVWWAYLPGERAQCAVMSATFGEKEGRSKNSYVDADSDHAWHLYCAFATIRGHGECPEKPAALEEANAARECCETPY